MGQLTTDCDITYCKVGRIRAVVACDSSAVGGACWSNSAVLAKVLLTAATATEMAMARCKPDEGNHDDERVHVEQKVWLTVERKRNAVKMLDLS
jgi:hypothetical protein